MTTVTVTTTITVMVTITVTTTVTIAIAFTVTTKNFTQALGPEQSVTALHQVVEGLLGIAGRRDPGVAVPRPCARCVSPPTRGQKPRGGGGGIGLGRYPATMRVASRLAAPAAADAALHTTPDRICR